MVALVDHGCSDPAAYFAVASFAFPAMLRREEGRYSFYLNQSVRALVGMVLIFSVYVSTSRY